MATLRPAHSSRGIAASAVLVLALGMLGCGGLGFRTRTRDASAAGVGAGARGAGPGAPVEARTVGSSGEVESVGEHDHEDELPALPAAEDPGGDDSGFVRNASSTGALPVASRYASLDRASCETELARRKVAFERVDEARGVIAPLRLKGLIGGVDFHSMLPLAQRRTSPYEIYDCRLVLALDDWARVLARHDVVEVVHYSVYRPPPAKAVLNGPGRRHSGALAIDAAIFKMRDGRTLSVEKDFHGRIGSKPCLPAAKAPAGLPPEAVTLRQVVCEAADAQLFNVLLTPDYNRPHRNHFHLEVTAGVRWVLVR